MLTSKFQQVDPEQDVFTIQFVRDKMSYLNRVEGLITSIDQCNKTLQQPQTKAISSTTSITNNDEKESELEYDRRLILLIRVGYNPKKIEVFLPDGNSIWAYYSGFFRRTVIQHGILRRLEACNHVTFAGYTTVRDIKGIVSEHEMYSIKLEFETVNHDFKDPKRYDVTLPVAGGYENIVGDDFQRYCTDGQKNDRVYGIEYIILENLHDYSIDISNFPAIKNNIYPESTQFS